MVVRSIELQLHQLDPEMVMYKNKINSIYPNPNINELNINFTLAQYGLTKISINDINGKEVKILSNEYYDSGEHAITCSINDLPNGTYYLNIKQNNSIISEKFIISK